MCTFSESPRYIGILCNRDNRRIYVHTTSPDVVEIDVVL